MVMINVGGFIPSGLQYRDKTSIRRMCTGHCLYIRIRVTYMYYHLVNMMSFTYMSRTLCFVKSRQSSVPSPSQPGISMLPCRHNVIGWITYICSLSTAFRIIYVYFSLKHTQLWRIARKFLLISSLSLAEPLVNILAFLMLRRAPNCINIVYHNIEKR